MKFILGKKIEMSQIFADNGDVIPVTLVKAGPCKITQVKSADAKDKYSAIQIGFDTKKKLTGQLKGHLKGLENYRWLREFSIDNSELKRGDEIKVSTFKVGDKVKIAGTSKGKGFQGVVKRHGFRGQKETHGNKDQQRMGGSVGATEPARVFKGLRMPGHMGDERITVKNLEIVKIDEENDILYIKGAVPGARNGLVEIIAEGELKVNVKNKKLVNTEDTENSTENTENKDSESSVNDSENSVLARETSEIEKTEEQNSSNESKEKVEKKPESKKEEK